MHNLTAVRLEWFRNAAKMVIDGSGLVAGHGGLQPVDDNAHLWVKRKSLVAEDEF